MRTSCANAQVQSCLYDDDNEPALQCSNAKLLNVFPTQDQQIG